MMRLLIPAAVTGALLGVGSLVLQRWVAETRGAAIALVAIWFAVVLIGVFLVLRRRPAERRAALAVVGVALVVTVAVGYWTGFRETEVDEDVVVATAQADGEERAEGLAGSAPEEPGSDAGGGGGGGQSQAVSLARGEVVGADGHAGNGTAEVIEEPDGDRVLTLTDLSVDPGPDVDVLLSASSEDVGGAVNLGGLKGSAGDQQYAIPESTDLRKFPNVVLYCNPFTVRIAVAELDV
jgi:hypothetical protein